MDQEMTELYARRAAIHSLLVEGRRLYRVTADGNPQIVSSQLR